MAMHPFVIRFTIPEIVLEKFFDTNVASNSSHSSPQYEMVFYLE